MYLGMKSHMDLTTTVRVELIGTTSDLVLYCYPNIEKVRRWKSDVSLLHIGREYNETGQVEEWWTQTSVDNFIDRTLCYAEQYSDFNLFGIYVCIHQYSI